MKKIANKITKYLLLFIMVIYDMMTPITVLAAGNGENGIEKGSVGINNAVSSDGGNSVTVSATNGNVTVNKTVRKTDTEGKYEVSFHISGEEVETTTTSTVPVYAVVVFDKSGSMYERECLRYEYSIFGRYCAERGDEIKFSSAVEGAKTFASTLLTNIPNAHIGLVTFSDNATIAKEFDSELSNDLSDADFGEPDGGTNLHAGLIKADEMLSDESIPANAKKYVVIISDGQPTLYINANGDVKGPGDETNKAVYDNTYSKAADIKEYAEVFAIGYQLPSGNVYNNMTAAQILANMATADSADDDYHHYMNANPEDVAGAFSSIASSMNKVPAGTDATLTDNIGSNFKITGTDGNQRTYESDTIETITKDGETVTFYVDIDEDSDGWVDVNNGFTLTYTDHEGNPASVVFGDSDDEKDPQVYWEGKEYKYVVNYYKDSFDTNPIASDEGSAKNGTVINSSDVELNKYLDNSELGTVGYEFNTVNPDSITITNDGEVKEINILYTIKKFNYTVNYFYADENNNYKEIPDSTTLANDIPYGTEVKASDYYLEESDIREGYQLDTTKTDSNTYTITDNGVVINIYYNKESIKYNVFYHFNKVQDDEFKKTTEALFGTLIKAEDNYLSHDELNQKYADYFLDENEEKNFEEKNIGKTNNDLNIYYINTHFSPVDGSENIDKNSTTTEVTSTTDNVSYTVNYKNVINNVRKGDTVTITVIDTLPFEIDESKSTLNGGVYNSSDKTITWTITKTADKFYPVYEATADISYSVRYVDFASISASDNNNLVNVAAGNTKVTHDGNTKTSTGDTDSSSVDVNIDGTLTVIYQVEGGEVLEKIGPTTKKAGTEYTTNQKDFQGYTFKRVEGNTTGTYQGDQDITVTYYYTKNDGNVTKNDVQKTGPDRVTDKNGSFDYTLTYKGRVEKYIGTAVLTLTDELPYEIDEEKSVLDENCKYANGIITCTKEYNITKDTDIEASFDLSLVFKNVTSDTVVNTVNSSIKLGGDPVTDTDTTKTIVEKGKLDVVYVSEDGTVLKKLDTTEALAGTSYETVEEKFFGYTFKEVKDKNEKGTYIANKTIEVEYIYTKNEGNIPTNVVTKEGTGTVSSINGPFEYTFTYNGRVEDYVGKATLTLTDTLPYELDEEGSTLDENCKYADGVITCTKEYDITKNTDINEEFKVSLVYKNVDSEEVINTLDSELKLDKKTVTDEDDDKTIVEKGRLHVIYQVENSDVVLKELPTTEELAGTDYETVEESFFGYTFKEVKDKNEKGKYLANQTIDVVYLYTKNEGNIPTNEVTKTGDKEVTSIDGEFNYTFTYNGRIEDYVGKATLTVTDVLPFEIDEEKSVLDSNCKYNDGVITCTKEYDITKDTDINEEFKVTLVYRNVDSETVTNNVTSKLELDKKTVTDEDSTETKVSKGQLIVAYVDEDGTLLTDIENYIDLSGVEYATEEKSFEGYSLKKINGETKGVYLANETIYVEYVYAKNIGDGEVEIMPPQTGVESTNTSIFLILITMVLSAIGLLRKENN